MLEGYSREVLGHGLGASLHGLGRHGFLWCGPIDGSILSRVLGLADRARYSWLSMFLSRLCKDGGYGQGGKDCEKGRRRDEEELVAVSGLYSGVSVRGI